MIKQTQLIISILLGVWLSACQVLDDRIEPPVVVDGDKIEVAIAASVPAITVQTRASGEDFENKLSHVDALVFEVDEQGDETFAYLAENKTDFSSLDYTKLEIKVKLKMSDNNEKYRVVFIANMKEEIKSFFEDNTDVEDMSKDDMLKLLTFTQSKKWPTGENDFRPLPMWGETEATIISSSTTSGDFGTMKLLRSVARIELNVSISTAEETNGSDVFDIKTVAIYNAREKGRAVPDPANLEDGKAIAPSLVEGTNNIISASSENNDMRYSLSNENDNKLSGIYVNEASNQGLNNENPLCLVIGAIYKGDSKITYYRVDFYNTSNQPVDILRNYTYNMTVTGVDGSGEDSEEKAVNSSSGKLTVAMTDWSDGDMKHVVFNGQNFLAVSESTLEVSKAEDTHEILVQTNYSGGWKAKVVEGNEWITNLSYEVWTPSTNDPEELKKIKTSLTFKVSENTEENGERTGVIRLSCGEDGHLELDVHITQTMEEHYELTILISDPDNPDEFIEFDKTINFHSGYHRTLTPRTLKIDWKPANKPLTVDFNPYFTWGEDTQRITEHTGGSTTFKVIPNALEERNDWYPEAVGDIQVMINNESNTQQNILIRRRHFEVYIEKADRYFLDGSDDHTFILYSNTDWEIEIPGNQTFTRTSLDLSTVIELEKYNGEFNLKENGDGEDIKFKLESVQENVSADIVVNIKFKDLDEWIDKSYTFHVYSDNPGDDSKYGEESNCYVLQAGGKSISIPVSQANRYIEKYPQGSTHYYATYPIAENEPLDIKFIWTDHPNGFDKDSNGNAPVVSAVWEDGNNVGPGARFIVKSGNVQGNAVIAVTDASDNIHWSWHIWVTGPDFDLSKGDEEWKGFRYYRFLDRNLGALSATEGNAASMGFYYQWGRKDPFPAVQGVKSDQLKPMYDAAGDIIPWQPYQGTWSNMENQNKLLYTIQNPHKFISSTAGSNWFSATWSTAMTDFWNEMENGSISTSKKGIFDPCPEGWKTIPGGAQVNNEWHDLPKFARYDSNGNYTTVIDESRNLDLGAWPHTGYINGTTGTVVAVDKGSYWTGTPNEFYEGYRFYFGGTTSDTHVSIAQAKATGLPVRCIRRSDTARTLSQRY